MEPVMLASLVLMFVALYIMVFWLILLVSKSKIFYEEKTESNNFPDITILIPTYNGERTIAETIESVLKLDYPKKTEVIVLVNGSTDNTAKIARKYPVKVVEMKEKGKAIALNRGIRMAKNEIVITLDDDSTPEKNAMINLVKYMADKDVAAATSALKIQNPKNLVQRLQALEYMTSIVLKKLLTSLNCLYVVPGPFSAYKKELFKEVGYFDTNNLAEDTEMGMRLLSRGYKIINSIDSVVYTKSPDKLEGLIKQRLRWFEGFLQSSIKHRDLFFNISHGDIGIYLPTVVLSILLMFGGITIGTYYLQRNVSYFGNWYRGFEATGFNLNYIYTLILDLAKLKIGFLDFDWLGIFFTFTLMGISIFTIYYGHKITEDKRVPIYNYGIYLLLYYQLMGVIWIGAVIKWLSGNKEW